MLMGLFPEAFKDKPKFLSTYSLCNIQNLLFKKKVLSRKIIKLQQFMQTGLQQDWMDSGVCWARLPF